MPGKNQTSATPDNRNRVAEAAPAYAVKAGGIPELLAARRADIAAFCRRWHIAKLEVFGSVLREDFHEKSDVDFLYTFEPDSHWGWEIVTLEEELAALVGRPVHCISRESVERSRNWIRREQILQSAREIYST
jgi:predicted nucleotidyltransferase